MKLENIVDWVSVKEKANVSEWYVIDDTEARKVATHFIDKGIEAGIEVALRDLEIELTGHEDTGSGVALCFGESFDFVTVVKLPLVDLAAEAISNFGSKANWDDGGALDRIIADMESALEILRADRKNFS